ncbi:MAG TPA: fasciclin domain-containing protein [Prolixibacteraceae bacterium]|nr:fasciclin domain-containing protein [Prolixibacteraceae bacterium]
MFKGKLVLSAFLLFFVMLACVDDFDKYARPEWLDGKVYSQLKVVDELSIFAQCLEITGYDTVIDVSGSYTVFAPTNEAFKAFFEENTAYNSVEDIPLNKLVELVEFHIVQNPWSLNQLRSLDVNGWIDVEDPYNDKPRGFKRQTLLQKDNYRLGIKNIGVNTRDLIVIDTTKTSWIRVAINDTRKHAPFFYSEYFGLYNLQLSDFSFYFNRNFDNPNDIYFVDAKIIGDEIFAENGFVYTIDKVVKPLLNAYEILGKERVTHSYSKFIDLVNRYPNLTYNQDETLDQPGASTGALVDSLYNLTYPKLTFDITSEKTKAPSGGAGFSNDVTIRFHHGLIAPTNQAFDEFIAQYVSGGNQWKSLEEMPEKIKKIIVNSYFSINPIYGSDIDKGFYNGENDFVKIDNSTIIEKEFGSNATFIGLNKALVPRAFKSVTGPVYRQRGFSTVMNAIEYTGLLSSLKRENEEYILFAPDDATLRADSSLFYTFFEFNNVIQEYFDVITPYPVLKQYRINTPGPLRMLLLNHIAVEKHRGTGRKEFLKTMAGNHIIWDNTTNIVKGTQSTVRGYQGSIPVNIIPQKISVDVDNGETYQIQSWFRFEAKNILGAIKNNADLRQFHNLLVKAGFANDKSSKYNFVSETQLYTVLVPSVEALTAISADTLSGENLKRFVQMHFIEGNLIFTDGKLPEGYYKTAYTIPAAGGKPAHKAKIYIQPGIDVIKVKSKNSSDYLSIAESEITNQICARSLQTGESMYPNIITTGVVHQIEKALIFDLIDVE